MKWKLFNCILLSIILITCAKERPKRSISYLKNMLSSKLFGSNPSVVIGQPIAQNSTHQIIIIPGYQKYVIVKLSENNCKEENQSNKTFGLDFWVAVLGMYLGTKSESETRLVIDTAKRLIETGIISQGVAGVVLENKERVITPQNLYPERVPLCVANPFCVPTEKVEFLSRPTQVFPVKPLDVLTEQVEFHSKPTQVFPVNPISVAEKVDFHPRPTKVFPVKTPVVVEEIYPVQTRYSYKQFGVNADMSYKSNNGKDVKVTVTEKRPPIPAFIKTRIAEVAAMPADIMKARKFRVAAPINVNTAPIPYIMAQEPVRAQYAATRHRPAVVKETLNKLENNPSPHTPSQLNKIPAPVGTKLTDGQMKSDNVPPSSINQVQVTSEAASVKKLTNSDKDKIIREIVQNHTTNGQIISKFSYKLVNSAPKQLSAIKYNDVTTKVSQTKSALSIQKSAHQDVPESFVYMPPEDKKLIPPPPITVEHKGDKINAFRSPNAHSHRNVPNFGVDDLKEDISIKKTDSLKLNPIIVADFVKTKESDTPLENNKKNVRRGDIPEAMY